jgi:hypothetical protein
MSTRIVTLLMFGILFVAVLAAVSSYTALPDAPATDAWTQQQISKREGVYKRLWAANERGSTEEEVLELQNEIKDITKDISDHLNKR